MNLPKFTAEASLAVKTASYRAVDSYLDLKPADSGKAGQVIPARWDRNEKFCFYAMKMQARLLAADDPAGQIWTNMLDVFCSP
jgi:hypothetical protein